MQVCDIKYKECLYDGQLLPIETVFTVNEFGEHINVLGEIERVRKLGRNKELFCPCGCGTNLMLVAGENSTGRTQHFRAYSNQENTCKYELMNERGSYELRKVLKLWLDNQFRLAPDDIEYNVTTREVADSTRKFEINMLVRTKGVGICYLHNLSHLDEDKMQHLKSLYEQINILYFTDSSKIVESGQYPEYQVKILDYQGFVLFVDFSDTEPENILNTTKLEVGIYRQNIIANRWEYLEIAKDCIKAFYYDDNNYLKYQDDRVIDLANDVSLAFEQELSVEKNRLFEEKQSKNLLIWKMQLSENAALQKDDLDIRTDVAIEQQVKNLKLEYPGVFAARAYQHWLDMYNENAMRQRELLDFKVNAIIDMLKLQVNEYVEQKKSEIEWAVFWETVEERLKNGERVIGPDGKRYLKCRECKLVKKIDFIFDYTFSETGNVGICNKCRNIENKKQNEIRVKRWQDMEKTIDTPPEICPLCGGKVVERFCKSGNFYGCSNYAKTKCRYTWSKKRWY